MSKKKQNHAADLLAAVRSHKPADRRRDHWINRLSAEHREAMAQLRAEYQAGTLQNGNLAEIFRAVVQQIPNLPIKFSAFREWFNAHG